MNSKETDKDTKDVKEPKETKDSRRTKTGETRLACSTCGYQHHADTLTCPTCGQAHALTAGDPCPRTDCAGVLAYQAAPPEPAPEAIPSEGKKGERTLHEGAP